MTARPAISDAAIAAERARPSWTPLRSGLGAETRAESIWSAAFGADEPDGFRYVLLVRFALVNLVALAVLAAAAIQGWIGVVLLADISRIVLLIAVVFLAGLGWCGLRVWRTSWELNQVTSRARDPQSWVADHLRNLVGVDAGGRATLAAALRLKLATRIAPVRHIATSLVFLGLIGTVLGFIIALGGVDPQSAADPGAIGPMVSTLIQGMSIALYTTLVGAVLNIWLMVNYRLLETGTVKLLTAVVELGEHHARA